MNEINSFSNSDLLLNKKVHFLLWRLPVLLLLIGCFTEPVLRTILWTISFSVLGISCLNNAFKCGRIHCYFTGPFYLLVALANLILGILGIRFSSLTIGWSIIVYSIIILGALLRYVPEMIWGKYKVLHKNIAR